MDFQKNYPIFTSPNEFIVLQWERGYRYVEASYNGRLITSISGIAQLKKGVKVQDPELGLVQFKLSEKPIAVDIIVDGFHSAVNVSYPTHVLQPASNVFIVLAVLAFLGGLYETNYGYVFMGSTGVWIFGILNLLIIGTYITTTVLIRRGIAWMFFVGFSVYSFFTLLHLLTLVSVGIDIVSAFVVAFRIVVTLLLIYYIKPAAEAIKHSRYVKQSHDELIDTI